MKKVPFYSLLLLVGCLFITACNQESFDKKESSNENFSKVGVWENGNYFFSLGEDKFLSAYIAPNFIDCGMCDEDDNVLKCANPYFYKETKYTIQSIDSESISVIVDYVDISGTSRTNKLTLYKTLKKPTTKSNILVGKTLKYKSSSYSNVSLNFATYYSGSMSSDKSNIEKCPLNIYYIFFNNYCYFQKFNAIMDRVPSIGGWNTDADDGSISVIKFEINQAGSISDFSYVTNEKL